MLFTWTKGKIRPEEFIYMPRGQQAVYIAFMAQYAEDTKMD